MSNSYTNVGIPVDQPAILRQGVRLRETDSPGAAKWLGLPPEDPLRAKKGDIGFASLPVARALSHVGVPFKNLTKG